MSRDTRNGGLSRLGRENLFAAVLLVVFGGIVWLCQDFGPRARMIPLPLAIFGIVLTVIQILWQNLRSADELQMDLISRPVPPAHAGATPRETAAPPIATVAGSKSTWRQEARAYGVVGLLIALVLIVGIIPAVFVFTAGYFVLTRHYSWLAGLVYTAVFTSLVYLLFIAALQIQPYHGLLTPFVERFR